MRLAGVGEETTFIAKRGRVMRGRIDHAIGFTSVFLEKKRENVARQLQ